MKTAFIFHGTEGYPEENWFPWLKKELEKKGYKVIVPHFPSPPNVPAKIVEWSRVLKKYVNYLTEETLLIGHSLGGIFTLRVLEEIKKPVKAAIFVGTPIGVRPILNYDRDQAFSGFSFDWTSIIKKAQHFSVFHSDDDPYVALANGEELAHHLHVPLTFVPKAGHFNTKSGYKKFERLLDKLDKLDKVFKG